MPAVIDIGSAKQMRMRSPLAYQRSGCLHVIVLEQFPRQLCVHLVGDRQVDCNKVDAWYLIREPTPGDWDMQHA